MANYLAQEPKQMRGLEDNHRQTLAQFRDATLNALACPATPPPVRRGLEILIEHLANECGGGKAVESVYERLVLSGALGLNDEEVVRREAAYS